MTSQSEFIGYAEVERLASLNNIHLRVGDKSSFPLLLKEGTQKRRNETNLQEAN
jgi:hypothetical protein